VDLADKKLEFAEWRYGRRGLSCKVVAVTDTETIPALPREAFDIVVASEVLEHVRDPLRLLQSFKETTRNGGLLFCTAGNALDRQVEGDHLPEAVEIGNTPKYREYFDKHYRLFSSKPNMPFLFEKVRSIESSTTSGRSELDGVTMSAMAREGAGG
jgi:SAM-dependent methyltransferase